MFGDGDDDAEEAVEICVILCGVLPFGTPPLEPTAGVRGVCI